MSDYCTRCNRKFAHEEALFNHTNSSSRHNICIICEEDLESEILLEIHIDKKHFPCPEKECDEVFADEGELKQHGIDDHGIAFEGEEEEQEEEKEDVKEVADKLAGASIDDKPTTPPTTTCICTNTFLTTSSLFNHIENGNCSALPCHLLYHVLFLTDSVSSLSSMTGPLFQDTASTLDKWVAEGLLKNECKGCGKSFTRKAIFVSHFYREWHIWEGFFRCEYCAKRFDRPSGLLKHRESGGC